MFFAGRKGQASFEMLFVVAIVVMLAAIVFVAGIKNFGELTALTFYHNSYNMYKVRENYTGELNIIDAEKTTDGVMLTGSFTKPATGFEGYSADIEKNIKENTNYNNVTIIIN